jgi:glycosyltransferase involved in cell wall biosynthesis
MITPSKQTGYLSSNTHPLACEKRLLVFDLSLGGHHPGYILHLVKYWGEHVLSGHLDIVVLPEFMEQHSDVVDAALEYAQQGIQFLPITPSEASALAPRSSFFSRKLRAFQEWNLLCKYARAVSSTQTLLMYFDTYQLSLLLGQACPCPVSAIYFRARFHYGNFEYYTPSKQEQRQMWREKLHLSLVLRKSKLKTLFCLDPFVVKYLDCLKTQVKAVRLPDPVQIYSDPNLDSKGLRQNLGIDFNRKVFLLFGALDGRKGLHKLLQAIPLLSKDLCQSFCLLLVGPISKNDKFQVEAQISKITQSLPVQIVTCDRFVNEEEIQPYFQLADVILAPYQNHVGMSGILVRAAATQKIILSSDYGLMGELVRRYKLGLAIDSSNPSKIAQGLAQLLLESHTNLCDLSQMQSFAEQNSAQHFAQVIFEELS